MSDERPSRTCEACGSTNPETARWCFQCHTPFPQAAPPPDAASGAVTGDVRYPYSHAYEVAPPTYPPPGGYPQYPPQPGYAPQTAVPAPLLRNEAPGATGALVLGILGAVGWLICGLPGLLGIGGVVLGFQARRRIRESGNALGGDGKAMAGIILGFIGIAMAMLVIAIVGSGYQSRDLSTSANSPDTESSPGSDTGGSSGARDGKFEFAVSSPSCGRTTVGDSISTKKAQGQFCLVNMTVTNISKETQDFFAANQVLIDTQGREHEADSTAGSYVDPDNQWATINPGNSISATVVWDIPANATPAKLELHDSAFSGGVKVPV